MIQDAKQIEQMYFQNLSSNFKNAKIPNEFKADNGLSKQMDNFIKGFAKDINTTFDKFTKSCKTEDIVVNGGGGSPGSWSGGIGTGGKITFNFDFTLSNVFDYSAFNERNSLIKKTVNESLKKVVESYSFTNLKFGSGSSSHTSEKAGSLITADNVEDTLKKVGIVSDKSSLENLNKTLEQGLTNFVLLEYQKDELLAIKNLLNSLFDYWLENTKISGIKASGGVTTASAGVLSSGKANGGTFK